MRHVAATGCATVRQDGLARSRAACAAPNGSPAAATLATSGIDHQIDASTAEQRGSLRQQANPADCRENNRNQIAGVKQWSPLPLLAKGFYKIDSRHVLGPNKQSDFWSAKRVRSLDRVQKNPR
jgi:hypothetical protein